MQFEATGFDLAIISVGERSGIGVFGMAEFSSFGASSPAIIQLVCRVGFEVGGGRGWLLDVLWWRAHVRVSCPSASQACGRAPSGLSLGAIGGSCLLACPL